MNDLIKKLNTEENKKEYNETSEKYMFLKDLLRGIELIGTNQEIDELEELLEA